MLSNSLPLPMHPPSLSRLRCGVARTVRRPVLWAAALSCLAAVAGAQQVGLNDFRITHQGPDGNPLWDTGEAAIAYNPHQDVYLVAYQGDTLGAAEEATEGDASEIFVQLVTGGGAPVGAPRAISTTGPEGDARFDAAFPDVVYNAVEREFLVVWQSDAEADNAFEIYGQRLDGATAAEVGQDFKITSTGPLGNAAYDAIHGRVAWSATSDRYLVAFQAGPTVAGKRDHEIYAQRLAGDGSLVGTPIAISGPDLDPDRDGIHPDVVWAAASDLFAVAWEGEVAANESQIFCELRRAVSGALVGTDSLQVSNQGPGGSVSHFDADDPAIAYSDLSDRLLVVWDGDASVGPGPGGANDDEEEIFSRLLDGSTGNPESPSVRLSTTGPDGDRAFDAIDPAVAWNAEARAFVVVWAGEELADGEVDIYGQEVDDATGAPVGPDDFNVSDMGPDGVPAFGAEAPALAYSPLLGEMLVVWAGDDTVDGELEIYGQFLGAGAPAPCQPTATRLCLRDGLFSLEVAFETKKGVTGLGQAVALTSDTGYFWFFQDTNVELVIKALDGRGVNGHFWIFYGALSDVEYTITVIDNHTGKGRVYFNPQGNLASVADTSAFPDSGEPAAALVAPAPPPAAERTAAARDICVPSATKLCLNQSVFEIEVAWKNRQGITGVGHAVPLTDDTGWLWFFDDANLELMIKVLDGRAVNGRYWVFYGALSDVEYTITVTNRASGQSRTYFNPQRNLASVADTDAF